MRLLQFHGSDGRAVRATLHEAGPGTPLVLVAHGFKGFREWGFHPYLCQSLASAGIGALRFDFSHNGVEERDFDRLDLFALDTWTRHQEDLRAIVDAFAQRPIGMVGHSRGGVDALLGAARDERLRAVATLSAPATTDPGLADIEDVIRRTGFYPVLNARTGLVMPVARTQIDDGRRYDVLASARALAPRPLLVVHARGDATVPVEHAERLARAHGAAETLLLEGSDHGFGAVHPFRGPTPELERVADVLCRFFARALAPGPPCGLPRRPPALDRFLRPFRSAQGRR